MRKIFLIIMLGGIVTLIAVTGNTAFTKRSFYDSFGESLNAQYWVLGFVDTNGVSSGSSSLFGEGWGFMTEQAYNLIYSDKYKKVKVDFKLGFEYRPYTWWCTDLLDVSLTPFTFQKVWWPGMMGTLVTPLHKGTMLFSRTSYMSTYRLGGWVYVSNPANTTFSDNTYLLGLRDEYTLKAGDVNLKLGGTFIHHWQENSDIDENSFLGNVDNKAPGTIYLRFSDDSPEDGNGARIYAISYRVDDGVSQTNVTPAVGSPYDEANGATTKEYSFTVGTTAKKVEISVSVANDYKIEVKTNEVTTYSKVASAPGQPTDGSIRTLTFNYGIWTSNQYIGFDAKGDLFGVKVDTECEYNLRWRKYPNGSGYRANEFGVSPVFYLKANKKFDKLLVGGDYFYTDPDYATYFDDKNSSPGGYPLTYVDDNDDKDWFVDGTGKGSGGYENSTWFISNPVPPYHLSYDRDSNGVPDWEQDLYLFTVDHPRFWTGDDRNNNIIADQYEDDPYADYPYRLNRQGYGIFIGYDLVEGLNLTGGYDDFGEVSSAKKTNNLYLITRYKNKIPDFGDITLSHQIKKVNDNIADDLTEVKNTEDGTTQGGSDPLNYKNSLLNILYVESNYTGFKNFTFSNKFRFDNNYQYDDSRNVRWAGFIANVKYDIKPSKILTITPQWKLWLEKGFSAPDYSAYSVDSQVNAFLLKLVYKILEKTTLTGGIQFKMLRVPLSTSSEYNKLTFVAQIVSKAGTYPLHFGYVRNLKNTPTNPVYSKDETTFLKIYLVK